MNKSNPHTKQRFVGVMSFDREPSKVTLPREQMRLLGVGLGVYDDRAPQIVSLKAGDNWLEAATIKSAKGSEDITPKESDFLQVPVRCISAGILGANTWKAVDFGAKEGVLKRGLKYFASIPLYENHAMYDVGNTCGLLHSPYWQEGYKNDDGVEVPAGINGIAAVNKLTNLKLAQDVLAGQIFSVSATIKFEWEMSHPFENVYDFFDKCGTIGQDGKMIRRIVTKILGVYEESFVFMPADPFARVLDENDQVRRVDLSQVYTLSLDGACPWNAENPLRDDPSEPSQVLGLTEGALATFTSKERFSDFVTNPHEQELIALRQFRADVSAAIEAESQDTRLLSTHELLGLLRNKIGVAQSPFQFSDAEIAEIEAIWKEDNTEEFKAGVPHLLDLVKKGAARKAALTQAEKKATEDASALTQLYADIAAGKVTLPSGGEFHIVSLERKTELELAFAFKAQYQKDRRQELVRYYSASTSDPDADFVKLLEECPESMLQTLATQIGAKLSDEFKPKCTLCGGEKISFRQSQQTGIRIPDKVVLRQHPDDDKPFMPVLGQ